MAPHNDNKYSVNAKIGDLQARVLALETANAALRTWVLAELATKIKDAENIIQDAQAADFRDLQVGIDKAFSDLKASVKDGVDGRDGALGPQGPRGDVLIPNADELSAAVKDMRIKLAQKHAAAIAPIVRRIEFEKGRLPGRENDNQSDWTIRHFTRLLEGILAEIEGLSR
jgi:hypothetical protein